MESSFFMVEKEEAIAVGFEEEGLGSGCPPEFVLPLEDLVVTEGETIRLKAIVIGYPAPEIQWFVDEDRIESSRYVQGRG